jgi:tetratricopeptide (TPR) repeat protein
MAGKKEKLIAEGDKLFGKGKVEGAIKAWEEALAETPKDVALLNKIGDAWAKINRVEDATRYYLRVGDHYASDGFFLKAIAMFKKINKNEPSRLDIYERLAELYAKQGLAMEAKSQYQVLADYHIKQGQTSDAAGVYLKIATLDPNNIQVHAKLADLLVQSKRLDEALKRYDLIGKMLLQKGMLDEAAQVYQKALKLAPGSPEALEALAAILQQKNDPAAALDILEQAAAGAPTNSKLLVLLGRTYAQLGRLSDSERVFTVAAGLLPNDPEITEARASIAMKRGDLDGAFRALKPLADAAAARGEAHRAVQILSPVLKQDPHHVGTLEAFVEYYQKAGEETTVLSHRNLLAEAFIARGEFERAAAVLNELVRIEPENLQHREKLSFVRQKMGAPPPTPAVAAIPVAQPAPPPQRAAAPPSPPPAPRATAPPSPPPPQRAPAPPPAAAPPASTFDETGSFLSKMDGGVVEAPEIEIDLGGMDEGTEPGGFGEPEIEIDLGGASGFEGTAESGEAISLGADRDFVTEHLTEADVFAKYGLVGKAIEHYELVLGREPNHKGALSRVLDLHIEEQDRAKVGETAQKLAGILRAAGDSEGLFDLEERLARNGIALPLAGVAAPSPRISTPAPTQPLPSEEPEIEIPVDEGEIDLGSSIDLTFDEVPELPTLEAEAPTAAEFDIPVEEVSAPLSFEAELAIEPMADEEPLVEPVSDLEISIEPSLPAEPAAEGVGEEEILIEEEAAPEAPFLEEPAAGEIVIEEAVAAVPPEAPPEPAVPREPEAPSIEELVVDELELPELEEIEDAEAYELPVEEEPIETVGEATIVSTPRTKPPAPAAVPLPEPPVEAPPPVVAKAAEPPVAPPPAPPVVAKAPAPAAAPPPVPPAAKPHRPELDLLGASIVSKPTAKPARPAAKAPSLDDLLGAAKPAKAAKPHPPAAAPSPDKITESFLRDLGMPKAKPKKGEKPLPKPPEAALPPPAAPEAEAPPFAAPAPPPPPPAEPEAEAPFAEGFDLGPAESTVEALSSDELSEVDFYLSQGLLEEAKSHLQRLEGKFPGHPDIAERMARLESAPSRRATGPVQIPEIASDDTGEFSMDLDLGRAIEEEMAKLEVGAAAGEPAPAPAVDEGNLFADEDSFFDLASELGQELAEEKAPPAAPDGLAGAEEASLEQIFKEFKKGVEQQLDSEDYDTHYNLGIAYKEMGLVDEAIGEFQIASKDPKRMIECCSMLGLCFLEKGMPQLAIKWYRKGLENPEIREGENLGLLYDLANVYQEIGDLENAHRTLIELYGVNAGYRDVSFRIKELEDALKG